MVLDLHERTDLEKLAYLDGFEAAIRMMTWRLRSVGQATALQQARAAANLARSTVQLEGERAGRQG